jgi:hypothetical protein
MSRARFALVQLRLPLLIVVGILIASASQAHDCGIWTPGEAAPQGFLVATGDGTTVIVGNWEQGVVFQRHGGGPWQRVSPPFYASDTNGLAWGADRFVAIGSSAIWASDDGLAWRQVAVPRVTPLVGIGWNGSKFAVLGGLDPIGGNTVMTSPDGLKWTTWALPFGVTLESVAWAGSQWVAFGNGLYTSPDAVTWTLREGGLRDDHFQPGSYPGVGALGWNGSQALAIGLDSAGATVAATSTDGVQWTIQPSGTSPYGPPAGNGRTWIAASMSGGNPPFASSGNTLRRSADGITWLDVDAVAPINPQRAIWDGAQFVAVGTGGMATSADGQTWSLLPAPDLTAVVWAGDRFVAVGRHGTVAKGVAYTSLDGLTWTPASVPPAGPVASLAWTGTQLVAVGAQGGVYTSPTGDVWTRQAVPTIAVTVDLASVTWSGSMLVAVGGQTALSSVDGVAWTAAPVAGLGASNLAAVTWGAGRFVAVGDQHAATSSNGTDWNATREEDSDSYLLGVAWNGTRFVAVGYWMFTHIGAASPIALVSSDGLTWAGSDVPPLGYVWTNVFWTGLELAATDQSGLLMLSTDGLTWRQDTLFPGGVTAVAGNETALVTVGPQRVTARMDRQGCTAPPPIGQAGAINTTIVTAARSSGFGLTEWYTDVELYNPSSSLATAVLYYLPRNADNSVAARRAVTVLAGQALHLSDVVGGLFGQAQSAGALLVSSAQPLLVTSRTDTWSLGQFVPGLPESAALAAGQEGHLIQLSETDHSRTNLGLASISPAPITVTATLYRSTGERLGAMQLGVPPFGSVQVNQIIAKLGAAPVDDAYAVVHSDTPGARYYAYASVVDNVSRDPLTVLPVLASSTEPLVLPAVAHTSGINGTVWRTDLEVHNPGALQATYRLELLRSGQDNTTPAAATYTLDPGKSVRYADVVASVFAAQGAGAIRVTPLSGAVAASARTFTDTGKGSLGQFIPATPLSEASGPGTGARLLQLRQSGTWEFGSRTNIGFVNATGAPITVTASLYAATDSYPGTLLGVHTETLPPYGSRQVNEIFATVTTADLADCYAIVTASGPDARFFAYASVVDNQSGAPVYVPEQ